MARPDDEGTSRDAIRLWLICAPPFVMAGITLSLGMLEDRGMIWIEARYGYVVGYGNAALAGIGSSVAAIGVQGTVIRRATLALICGALAVATYFAAFYFGALALLDLDL
jgi:hypothetical protein